MENFEKETIAAIATALSDSGIGIVRISGENAIYIVDSIFRSTSGKKIPDPPGCIERPFASVGGKTFPW